MNAGLPVLESGMPQDKRLQEFFLEEEKVIFQSMQDICQTGVGQVNMYIKEDSIEVEIWGKEELGFGAKFHTHYRWMRVK